jgi:hypothetical protein
MAPFYSFQATRSTADSEFALRLGFPEIFTTSIYAAEA